MRILIVGFGSAGRRHMRNLNSLGENDIIFYRSGRSVLPVEELKGVTVETDLRKALGYKPVAAIIANPTAYHLDAAIPAAEAGCHILMEKPISHNFQRIEEFKAALKRGGGNVLMGFQLRFHPCYQQTKKWLEQGEVGDLFYAHAHYGDYLPGWHPWEDYSKGYSAQAEMGGGVVATLCHPLDYLRWLLGEVSTVQAVCSRVSDLEIDVEDNADILLGFSRGAVGSVHLDYYQRPPSYRFEIIGSKGTIQWDEELNAARLYRSETGSWEIHSPPPGFERNNLFLEEMRHFLKMVKGEELPAAGLSDGVRNLEIIQAVYLASKTGRRVSLPDRHAL